MENDWLKLKDLQSGLSAKLPVATVARWGPIAVVGLPLWRVAQVRNLIIDGVPTGAVSLEDIEHLTDLLPTWVITLSLLASSQLVMSLKL